MKKEDIHKLVSILECPDCQGEIKADSGYVSCLRCKRGFTIENNILDMLPIKRITPPDIYKDPDYLKLKRHQTIYYMYKNPALRVIQDSGHRLVKRLSEKSKFAVEVGCGNGAHYCFLENKKDLIGLDKDRERLLDLSQKEPEIYLILGDNYALPFKENSIPQIISIYALEHMYFLEKALEEMKRVLKREGKLLVSIPTEGSILWDLGRRFTTQRHFNKKLGVDYRKCMKIEHCNCARKILKVLKRYFVLEKIIYWPTFIPLISLNLTITIRMSHR